MKTAFLLSFFISMCSYSQWIQTNNPENAHASKLASHGSTIYASLYGGTYGTIDSSTDAGNTWISSGLHLTSFPVLCFAINESILIAGTPGTGLLRSTDRGSSWNQIQGLPLGITWFDVHHAFNNFFAAFSGGVFVSSDSGSTWNLTLTDPGNYHRANDFASDSTRVYVSTRRGVYFSTDDGSSWTSANNGLLDTNLSCVESNGKDVFVGTGSGKIFRSSDQGMSWIEADNGLPGAQSITTLFASGTHLFAGTSDGGLFLTRNYGLSWIMNTMSLSGGTVKSFASDGNYLFAGIWGGTGGVWRCPLILLTSVREMQIQNVPRELVLEQNYPNPFNPSTTINYQLIAKNLVILKIYDLLGREVQTLINEKQDAGYHSFVFNANNLPAGLYFYRLHAGSSTETKQLILLR